MFFFCFTTLYIFHVKIDSYALYSVASPVSSCRLDSFAHLTRPLFGVKTFRRPWLSVDSYFSTAPTAPPTHSYSMLGGREERKQENFPDFFPLLLTLTLMAQF